MRGNGPVVVIWGIKGGRGRQLVRVRVSTVGDTVAGCCVWEWTGGGDMGN